MILIDGVVMFAYSCDVESEFLSFVDVGLRRPGMNFCTFDFVSQAAGHWYCRWTLT